MSQRTIFDCDKCGKQNVRPVIANVPIGSHACQSGNGTETDYERVDLCPACAGEAIEHLIGKWRDIRSAEQAGRDFVQEWKMST